MPDPRRIGLFGGTFDPVHLGHLHLARLAREAAGLDEVRFLPCRISPHKPGTPPASGEDRVNMLRLATQNLPWATVDPWELEHPGPSYSYLTAEEMVGREPNSEWFWIMGSDQWDALPTWAHPERLAALVTFLVLARGSVPAPRPGFRMQLVPGDHPESSTRIRALVAAGTVPESSLPPAVSAYLTKRGLYRGQPPLASSESSD